MCALYILIASFLLFGVCFRKRKEQAINDTMAINSSYVTFDINLHDGNPVTDAVPLNEQLSFVFTGKYTDTHPLIYQFIIYMH